VKNKETV